LNVHGGTISGTLQKWQPVRIDFNGPRHSEQDTNPNPFLNYRLEVEFINEDNGVPYVVPGFFAGDGKGGSTGTIWRVLFSPDREGVWNYRASFRSGPDVSISLDPLAGEPTAFNGETGSFSIKAPAGDAPLFFKKGRLESIGSHYLKFRDGEYWLKQGINSPENFLGYHGFDNTPKAHHFYKKHIQDWKPGDPDWDSPDTPSTTEDGRAIIGAINYLSSQHINSIYFMPMNIGGDGQDTWPYSSRSINASGALSNDNLHFDISKLDQWDIVFTHAQEKGLFLHVVLSEAEMANKKELDNAALGIERKLYFREMIARFGHHNAMQWNLCEEYNLDLPIDPDVIKKFAQYVKTVDPYDHPIAVHNTKNTYISAFSAFMGDDRFGAISIQVAKKPDDVGFATQYMRKRTSEKGRPLPCSVDECLIINPIPFDEYRKRVIWDAYLSGGSHELFVSQRDISLENFRSLERLFRYYSIARHFVETTLPFWEMKPSDDLVSGENTIHGGAEVFSQKGVVYAVYLPSAQPTPTIELANVSGKFSKRWFNPRNGEFEGKAAIVSAGGSVSLGRPPHSPGEDWVVLIRRKS
jgi:hypothetical protein